MNENDQSSLTPPREAKPWEQHPIRTLHACVETLAHAFKGYLPWMEEQRSATVRGHEMLIEDTVKRADACMTIIEHGERLAPMPASDFRLMSESEKYGCYAAAMRRIARSETTPSVASSAEGAISGAARDSALASCDHLIRNLDLEASERWRLEEIRRFVQQAGATQAKLDRLMLEHCPEEMTQEQLAEWGKNQRPVSAEEDAAVTAALSTPSSAIGACERDSVIEECALLCEGFQIHYSGLGYSENERTAWTLAGQIRQMKAGGERDTATKNPTDRGATDG